MGYNKAIIVGNLGQDPKLRYTNTNNVPVVNLSVCSNERFGKTETGKPKENKEWFRVVAFNAMAEAIDKNFKKGRPILVEGRMQTRQYEVNITTEVEIDGRTIEVEVPVKREVTELIASRFEFMDEGTKWGTSSGNSTSTKTRVQGRVKGSQQQTAEENHNEEADYQPDEYPDDEIPF